MATLTIAAAARLCHCDRRTLQRSIHTVRLHLDAQHCLSREELIRTGYLIEDTPLAPPLAMPQDAPQATPLLAVLERLTIAVEGVLEELRHWREHAAQTPLVAPPVPSLAEPLETPQVAPLVVPLETPQVAPLVVP